MKFIQPYKEVLNCQTADEVFLYLISNLKETIKSWDYFVNWNKVLENVSEVEVSLNILNTLVGKENIKEEFVKLLCAYPEIIEALPLLIACRDQECQLFELIEENIFGYKIFDFHKKGSISADEALLYAEFLEKTGVLELFKDRKIKNVVDYVTGVEVGLDSNGRKNRSGKAMENLTEIFVKKVCDKYGYKYLAQANSISIKTYLGETVAVDKNNRQFDFVIKTPNKLYMIETNFYGGGGSKLKATAGEFKALFDFIKNSNPNHGFIWITDGVGWLTSKNPLKETFEHVDYIFNLEMLQKNILEYVVSNEL
jgi:type II restriction enzyme